MGILDKLFKRFEGKLIKKEKGVPILYVIYDPTKEEPNVIYHQVHPELQESIYINKVCQYLADGVRAYYKTYPDKLEEIKKMIEEGANDK